MKIGRYNYRAQFSDIEGLIERMGDCLATGRYVLTKEVLEFEQNFARYLEVSHARGVNTGTDALVVALLALDIGPGDEVITQANTFNATVAAICLVGATPVLVDVDGRHFNMDADRLEAAITDRTRAIMPVHLYGLPGPMGRVREVAERFKLRVVEDAAQSVGARWRGRRVGGIGDIGCFSFHPSKNFAAAGDGGAVVTNDPELDEKVRQHSQLGQKGQNAHQVVGLNSKLDTLQALVLSHKFAHLDEWNRARNTVAEKYRERLRDLPVGFQATRSDCEHAYHLFQLRTTHRDDLLAYLHETDIDAVVRYPTPIHLQPAFSHLGWRAGQFPISERLAEELVCLPIRPDMTDAEIDYVSDAVRSYLRTVS